MNKFKARLKELRHEKGLTQAQLGELIGYSRVTISDWESRGTEPDYDTLISIAQYFDVSLDFLLGLEEMK